jgi:hypothetical protein
VSQPDKPQLDKFKDLARELEADEDEARFEETVRKIAPKDRPSKDQSSDG